MHALSADGWRSARSGENTRPQKHDYVDVQSILVVAFLGRPLENFRE